jgi:hypothetical protein
MIREGGLMLEAEDKYDLSSEQPNDDNDDDQTDPDGADTDSSDSDSNDAASGDGSDVSGQTDDEGQADPTDSDPATSDDLGDGTDDGTQDGTDDGTDEGGGLGDGSEDGDADLEGEEEPKPPAGELLPLDATSRAVLGYRALRQYRALKDSVGNMISGISSIPTLSDEAREIIDICNSASAKLSDKLTDYILYRYSTNSLEVNYQNYMQFVLEKRTIQQTLEQISKITTEK